MTAAPHWAWKGAYRCPECGEVYAYMRENGFPVEWTLEVYHDHQLEVPVWCIALYHKWKGRRLPAEVKMLRLAKGAQKKRARELEQGRLRHSKNPSVTL